MKRGFTLVGGRRLTSKAAENSLVPHPSVPFIPILLLHICVRAPCELRDVLVVERAPCRRGSVEVGGWLRPPCGQSAKFCAWRQKRADRPHGRRLHVQQSVWSAARRQGAHAQCHAAEWPKRSQLAGQQSHRRCDSGEEASPHQRMEDTLATPATPSIPIYSCSSKSITTTADLRRSLR